MAYDTGDFKGLGGVNVAECLRVADLVERSTTFGMPNTYHPCGAPQCIVGHTLGFEGFSIANDFAEAETVLGITAEQGDELFCPSHEYAMCGQSDPAGCGFITATHAAACLRKLAATGEVDWLGTKPGVDQ